MAKKKTTPKGGLAIGGSVEAKAGRDVNIAGGDITTGLSFDADWKDSALSVLGDAQVSPVVRSHTDQRLNAIEAELEKDEPDTSLIQRFVGEIEQVIPVVATALRMALPFLK